YKYFADAEALLLAWHERQVSNHLDRLTEIRDGTDAVDERLEKVLEAFALIAHEHPVGELVSHLHHQEHVMHAQQRLHDFIRKLLSEAVESGVVRNDVAPDELANYCLHSLTAASHMPSRDGVRRLVTVTLTGLRQA
ncbi:MAG TPA: hypothetical protein VFD39_13560, partial [Trueperaceae bacterium]|nr:hypothetical protein [Trueperaceae bacterium]